MNRNRSSRPEVFYKKKSLKIPQKFTGKHLYGNLFLIKLRPATLLKRNSTTGVFLRTLRHFLRDTILQNICGELLWSVTINKGNSRGS